MFGPFRMSVFLFLSEYLSLIRALMQLMQRVLAVGAESSNSDHGHGRHDMKPHHVLLLLLPCY